MKLSLLFLATFPLLSLAQVVTRSTVVPAPTLPPPISTRPPTTPPPSSSTASGSSIAPPIATSAPVNTTVSYDALYSNASGSLSSIACSDGKNGLLTRGFTTFGSLPKFPYIGGGFPVGGWNSAGCGTCWELAYTGDGTRRTITVLAIDVAVNSFNVAPAALDALTGGKAVALGRANAVARQVAASVCGL